MAALGTEKGDLSRYITIAKQIPSDLIEKIGPARKAGRPRWQMLADLLSKAKPKDVDTLTSSDGFLTTDSDGRFALLIRGLQHPRPTKPIQADSWSTKDGRRAAAITHAPNRTVLAFDDALVPDFGDFLVSRLDRLYEEFLAGASKN
jgi:ParB family transcriptional regulator, chromosome partitioning protein